MPVEFEELLPLLLLLVLLIVLINDSAAGWNAETTRPEDVQPGERPKPIPRINRLHYPFSSDNTA